MLEVAESKKPEAIAARANRVRNTMRVDDGDLSRHRVSGFDGS